MGPSVEEERPFAPDLAHRTAACRGLLVAERLVDLLAVGADGELLGVAPRHPLLAAQRPHGLAAQCGLQDLVLLLVNAYVNLINILDI